MAFVNWLVWFVLFVIIGHYMVLQLPAICSNHECWKLLHFRLHASIDLFQALDLNDLADHVNFLRLVPWLFEVFLE